LPPSFLWIDFAQWQLLSGDEQRKAKTALTEIAAGIRATENTAIAHTQRRYPKGRPWFYFDHA